MEIYYDNLQEGLWFKKLSHDFDKAKLIAINDIVPGSPVSKVLIYDRPDIILSDDSKPILVIERTVEVPTGHNVGQRFARLAAAAEAKIPLVYFGPYMARKHGGATSGPRYMNLRLFYALDVLADINKTPVTTINWPVDKNCELVLGSAKDELIKEYVDLFLAEYKKSGLKGLSSAIFKSSFHAKQTEERENFIKKYVRAPKEYDLPPPSVKILDIKDFLKLAKLPSDLLKDFDEVVLYNIGMTYVRSDPYTGTGMLYQYLYVLGEKIKKRALVLKFPYISKDLWEAASKSGKRKDIRLFTHIADLALFKDSFWIREPLVSRSPEPIIAQKLPLKK